MVSSRRRGGTLWEDEAKAGRPLAEIKIMDGVAETEDLKRLDRPETNTNDETELDADEDELEYDEYH